MDQFPVIGDVISIGQSPKRLVVVESKFDSDDFWDLYNNLDTVELNTDGSFNSTYPVFKVVIVEPYHHYLPLAEEEKTGYSIEEIATRQEYFLQEKAEIKARKSSDEHYLEEISFHGHMTRTFIWQPPNTLLP